MKKIHLVIIDTENGKNYAHAESYRTGENLKAHFDDFPKMSVAHLCDGATESHNLAAYWNECYKKNGTYLFG